MAASPTQGSFGSDEDSWFGGDDRDAEARAEQSVAAVGARIIGAKPFPIAARRLEELTRNPKARLEQVVSVLETDPGLSVRLLRLVNSAGYGLKVRVTSVRHAAVLVGTRRLHQVATTAAILDLFETTNETAIELLEHATVVGSLCRYLAVHLGLPHDELFTCGFLHDIGKLMLLDTEGDKYAALVREYGHEPDQMHIQERKLFGFDHAVLGSHVLSAWNIPEPVPKVVAFHHNPARAMQDTLLSSMVYTLRLADLMSYAVHNENEVEAITQVTESEAALYLEISEPQLAAMWTDLRALADRSRARSHGQPDMEVVAPRRLDVPRSLRPRRSGAPRSIPPGSLQPPAEIGPSSQRPSSSRMPTSSRAGGPPSEVHEVPDHFPCVACSKPSFGNICPACEGQVCPDHQVGPDHWCTLCMGEYTRFREKNQVPGYLKVTALALAGFSVGASITGVMVSQTFAVWKLVVAPLTMVLLWGVLLPVAHRLWQRKRFLRTRPKGRVPAPVKLPRPNPVFISSLDANLENDGLMGPSIAPPSQSGISGLTPAATIVMPAEPTLPDLHTPVPLASPTPVVSLATASMLVASPADASLAPPAVSEPAPSKDAETTAVSAGISPDILAAGNAAAAQLAATEQAEREQAEQAESARVAAEQAARAQTEREQAVRERAERELASRAQAEREQAAREQAERAAQQAAVASDAAPSSAPSSEREMDDAAAAHERTSDVMPRAEAQSAQPAPEEHIGPLVGAAASLNPPSARPPRDNVAAHIASLLGEPSGLSEFPSVGSESELENVVASVSARLAREFPQNDYMGPSADLRAASIAPIPEPAEAAPPVELIAAPPPAIVEAPAAIVEAPVVAAAALAPAVEATPVPPVSEVTASAQAVPSEAEPTPTQATPLPLRLVFPRQALEQGCAPRSTVFRCAIPVNESCSPAPRRTSLRPSVMDYSAGDTVAPGTLRGLG